MIDNNKVIKNLGIGLAILLIAGIVTLVAFSFFSVTKFFIPDSSDELNKNIVKRISNINNIDISLGATKLNILEGNSFSIDTNNKYLNIEEKNGFLYIKEKSHLKNIQKLELNITIPKNKVFANFNLKGGAGSIKINKIETDYFNFELGAGKAEIENINVLKKADISLGAGAFSIKNGSFSDLDYNGSIGKSEITASLNGNTVISGGIGKLDLKVLNPKSLYRIEVEKGLGTISIDNEKYDNGIVGTGNKLIRIASGIGKINLSFSN